MSDDLVAKLRKPNGILDWELRHVCADRIEALERDVELQKRLTLSLSNRVETLEAALREIATFGVIGVMSRARRALEGEP